jgi:hypothetical protein
MLLLKKFLSAAMFGCLSIPALAQADSLVIAGGGGSSYVGSGTAISSVTLENMYVNYGTGEFSNLTSFSPIAVVPTTFNTGSTAYSGLFTFGTFSFNSTSLTATEINQGGEYEFELQGSGTMTNSATHTTEASSFTLSGETTTPGTFEGYSATLTTSPVPVPAALPLLLSGVAGIGIFARRRKIAQV